MKEGFEIHEVINNEKDHRFEINLNGEFAIIPYNFKDDMEAVCKTFSDKRESLMTLSFSNH